MDESWRLDPGLEFSDRFRMDLVLDVIGLCSGWTGFRDLISVLLLIQFRLLIQTDLMTFTELVLDEPLIYTGPGLQEWWSKWFLVCYQTGFRLC